MTEPAYGVRDDVTALILAGGAGSRMGRDKALLRLDDGRTALAWVLEAARGIAAHQLLAVDTGEHAAALLAAIGEDELAVVLDERPGAGPLAALAGAMTRTRAPLLIALAVDTPFVRRAVLAALLDAAEPDVDAVAPLVGSIRQPLQAVYRRTLYPVARDLVQRGSGSVQALLRAPGISVRYVEEAALRRVDPALQSFRGANTPAEWEALLADRQREGEVRCPNQ